MFQFEWEQYLLGEKYQHDVVIECINQIGAKIFGKDHAGSNTYMHVRRKVCKIKLLGLYVTFI